MESVRRGEKEDRKQRCETYGVETASLRCFFFGRGDEAGETLCSSTCTVEWHQNMEARGPTWAAHSHTSEAAPALMALYAPASQRPRAFSLAFARATKYEVGATGHGNGPRQRANDNLTRRFLKQGPPRMRPQLLRCGPPASATRPGGYFVRHVVRRQV